MSDQKSSKVDIPDIPNSHIYKTGGYEGWLNKFGTRNKKWQRRYFILKDNKLKYFHDIKDIQKGRACKDVDVSGSTLLTLKRDDYNHEFCFAILPINVDMAFVLSAKDMDERVKWTQALNQVGAIEYTTTSGVSDGKVDRKSLREDYSVVGNLGKTPLRLYLILRSDHTLSYYHYKCDTKTLGVLDLNEAKFSSKDMTIEISIVHPAAKTIVLTFSHKDDTKEWLSLLQKTESVS